MKKIAMEIQDVAKQFNNLIVTDQETIVNMLYKALADEWLAYYQYWAASHCTRGEGKVDVDPEFEEHAKEELEHAEKIIIRIKELGGRSFVSVSDFDKFCSVPNIGAPSQDPCELLKITIKAEEDAINFYKELEKLSRGVDPTTNRIVKQILEDEEKHLYDLNMLLEDIEAGK